MGSQGSRSLLLNIEKWFRLSNLSGMTSGNETVCVVSFFFVVCFVVVLLSFFFFILAFYEIYGTQGAI